MTGSIPPRYSNEMTVQDWEGILDDLASEKIQGVYKSSDLIYVQEKGAKVPALENQVKLERNDIQEIIDKVNQATGTVLKRKGEEDQERPKKVKTTTQTLSGSGKQEEMNEIVQLLRKVSFRVKMPPGVISLESLAQTAIDMSRQLLSQKEPVTQEQIKTVYSLLFETKLKDHLQENLSYPRPAWAFQKLYEAMDAVSDYEKLDTPEGDYTSEVRILKNKEGVPLWIFKPVEGETFRRDGIPKGGGGKREHVAYLLNYDNFFPIPFTAYVELGGKVGSVQKFMPGHGLMSEQLLKQARRQRSNLAKNLSDEDNQTGSPPAEDSASESGRSETESTGSSLESKSPSSSSLGSNSDGDTEQFIVNKLDPQQVIKLIIFDLLFCNTDRLENNVFIHVNYYNPDYFEVYGIDNGCILTSSFDDLIRTCLDDYKQAKQPINNFEKFIKDKDRLKKYICILQEHDMPQEAIAWLQMCFQLLGASLESKKEILLSDVASFLKTYRKSLINQDPEERKKQFLEAVIQKN
jgi:hypothetical protein